MHSILIISPSAELTFIAQDIEILSRAYRVEVLSRRDHPSRRQLLAVILRRLVAARHSLVYMWFADPYDSPFITILAKLLRVRSAIVVGGYDVAWLPALGYGALSTWSARWKVRAALLAADTVLPTSDLLASEVRQLGRKRKVRVIYPGVDCSRFAPGNSRERLVVTVGTVGRKTWQLKGLDVFAQCSRLMPDVPFVIVGPCVDEDVAAELCTTGGENLALTKRRLPPHEILAWYQRASVYAQLSARESFGLALAEAMACGCAPVATNVGFLPELVGDTGFLVDYGDAPGAVRAIRQALESDVGTPARERVRTRYPLEGRERQLSAALSELLS